LTLYIASDELFASWRREGVRRFALPWIVLSIVAGSPAAVEAGLFDKLAGKLTSGADHLVKECEQGKADMCRSAGTLYRHGSQVEKNLDLAEKYFSLGCNGGDSGSCHELYSMGFAVLHGKQVPKDDKHANRLFERSCEPLGGGKVYSGPGCHELARTYLNARGVPMDKKRGAALLGRACDGNSRRACADWGDALIEGKITKADPAAAVAAYTKACSGKEKLGQACMHAGILYADGKLVPRDIKRAGEFLSEACKFPDWIGTACYRLARLYETGLTGAASPKEIAELYHVACTRAKTERSGDACVAAAQKRLQGAGVEPDPNWVNELYSQGCRLKHRESCRLSCEYSCKRGTVHACRAVERGKIPIGVANCYAVDLLN